MFFVFRSLHPHDFFSLSHCEKFGLHSTSQEKRTVSTILHHFFSVSGVNWLRCSSTYLKTVQKPKKKPNVSFASFFSHLHILTRVLQLGCLDIP